jgi:peptidoglycan/xylan/chitin deacetylase (PgdA/CDA1 family)
MTDDARTGRAITLTIDNGPEPAVTPTVLDILARRGVRTTFFVLGDKVATPEGRRLAERAHGEGHWIGNHTWSHGAALGRLGASESVAEIARTQDAIGDLAHPDKLFRPVGGGGALGPHLLSRAAYDHLVAGGYTCVLWNVVPGDVSRADTWVETAIAQCSAEDEPLLVLHDLPGACVGRLDAFLGLMLDRGFTFRQAMPAAEIVVARGVPTPRAATIVAAVA